ncbi:MAG: hypothetical protein FJ109_07305 [Deltaproteobacteria bacterium]|nr:hypothetical protein [Deltaproteobacteria bacterium]
MKTCVMCGTQWPDKANFCPRDGAKLRDTITVDPIPGKEDDDRSAAPQEQAPASKREEAAAAVAGTDRPAQAAVEEPSEEIADQQREVFSETQWFMAAVDPESLKEEAAAPDEIMELQGKYRRDESISEEQRSRFTLRRKKGK